MGKPVKVGDLLGSRRDLLRIGGFGLLGASIDGVGVLDVASAKQASAVHPRGTARNVLF